MMKTGAELILPTAGDNGNSMIGGFISYNSKNNSFLGNGFIARVDVIYEKDHIFFTSNWAYTTSVGSAIYTHSSKSELSAIVINPQPAQQRILNVDYIEFPDSSNTCSTVNSMDILEIGQQGHPNLLGRLCGSQSNISYTTEGPILALFYCSSTLTGRGVKLSWIY